MDTTVKIALIVAGMNLFRYVFTAGIAFLIFYVCYRKKWLYKKIQSAFPRNKDYRREVLYSLMTIVIFAFIAILVFRSPLTPYTQVYRDIEVFGWGYFFLSIFMMIVFHDTYFYWMHRFMHHPRWFKYFHLVHHKSTNPSPWAAYAFHPLEGIVEAGVILPMVFLFPVHPRAVLLFVFFMIVYNVYGHLGFELYPKDFHKHWLGRWMNTSVNHNMHHKHFKGNYGLYFLFWDRWMGTIHEEYDARFEAVTNKRQPETMKKIPAQ